MVWLVSRRQTITSSLFITLFYLGVIMHHDRVVHIEYRCLFRGDLEYCPEHLVEILVSTGHLVRGKAARSLSWEVQGSLMTVSVSSLTVRPGW